MKTALILLVAALSACAAGSRERIDRTDLAKPLAEGVEERDVLGMRLLVKRVPHEPMVSARLYLLGGVQNWSEKDAGIERLALGTAVSGGTAELPKEAFDRKLADLGSQLGAQSTNDYAAIGAKALSSRWRPTLDLLAAAFLRPALPAGELEVQRQLQLSALRQEEEDPDAELELLSNKLVYHGLPYANRALGTAETVSKLTRDDLVRQLAKLRETSRMLLVVVGDVGMGEVEAWAKGAFGGLPRGDFRPQPLVQPTFASARVEVEPRPLPTNYLLAAFPAPSWRSPDLAVAAVAMNALREKLFEEVRTKRELSYAPSAGLALRGLGEGFLYVTAVDPNLTFQVMLDTLHGMQEGKIDPTVLEGDKRIFLTHFLMRDQSTDGQAELLASAQILGGDWRLAGTLLDRARAVTPAEVSTFLRAHAKDLQTVVVGDPGKIDPRLFSSF
ncbi:MAG: M16 family metallopeptidase [Deltaproteobacteria bacterium]